MNQEQLAASQLREQQLREALLEISQVACELSPEQKISNEALALPFDTSALEAMIAKAGEVMLDRCAVSISKLSNIPLDRDGIVEAMYALPGVTMEDLKNE